MSTKALFEIADASEIPFAIEIRDISKIEHARRILSGEETLRVHVQGMIVKREAPHNPGRSFHLDPDSIDFFEVAMEVCGATVS